MVHIDTVEKIRTTIIVHGNVQKSDYRGRVISIAKNMNITGTIQNISDGNVKIIAEGEKTNIDRFCDEIDIKNFLIKVTKIERKEDSEYIGEYESFYKLVGEGETDERLDTAAELLKQLIVVTKDGFTTLGENTTNGLNRVGEKIDILGENTTNGLNRVGEKIDILGKNTTNGFNRVGEKIDILGENTTNGFNRVGEKIDILGENTTNGFNRVGEKIDILGENTTNGFNRVGEKIDILREDTNQNFQRMDEKYSKLSEAMFAIVEKIEEKNQIFEERIEKIEERIEKTNKNIESLLNILVKQV